MQYTWDSLPIRSYKGKHLTEEGQNHTDEGHDHPAEKYWYLEEGYFSFMKEDLIFWYIFRIFQGYFYISRALISLGASVSATGYFLLKGGFKFTSFFEYINHELCLVSFTQYTWDSLPIRCYKGKNLSDEGQNHTDDHNVEKHWYPEEGYFSFMKEPSRRI